MTTIRPERPGDAEAVRDVLASAFPTAAEADLVERLREGGEFVALVAEAEGEVVGHIAFSPVVVEGGASGLGLAPLAVRPEWQGRGAGSRLVREGLEACRGRGCPFVVVIGGPDYYTRFGFRPAAEQGLGNEFGAGEEFQVVELGHDTLPAGGGLVRYAPEFDVFRP